MSMNYKMSFQPLPTFFVSFSNWIGTWFFPRFLKKELGIVILFELALGEDKINRYRNVRCLSCEHTQNNTKQTIPAISPPQEHPSQTILLYMSLSYSPILASVWKRTNQPELISINEMNRNTTSVVFILSMTLWLLAQPINQRIWSQWHNQKGGKRHTYQGQVEWNTRNLHYTSVIWLHICENDLERSWNKRVMWTAGRSQWLTFRKENYWRYWMLS